MKKIVTILIFAAVALLLTSCSLMPSSHEDYLYGDGTVSASITELYIDWPMGEVNISYSGSILTYAESADENIAADDRMCYKTIGQKLYIAYTKSSIATVKKVLTLTLPEGSKLRALYINSNSAAVSINGISVGGVIEINNISGAIKAEIPSKLSNLNFKTVSGNVSLSCGKIGEAIFTSTSGDIIFKTNSAPKIAQFNLISASAELIIPATSDMTISFSTANGEFSSELESYHGAGFYKIGKGSSKIYVSSVSGNFKVSSLPQE